MIASLERFYPYAPVWAQNLGINLYGLVWRRERLGGDFEQYVADFRERDRCSGERMRAYVHHALRSLLVHAFEDVPYYQERWAAAGITREDLEQLTVEDLPKLPWTPKQDVRNAPEAFVSRALGRHQKLHPYRTSGSTGTPVTTYYSAETHRQFIAAREVRSFGWAGTSVRQPRAMIGGRLVVPHGRSGPPFHRYNWVEHQVYFSAYHIAPQNAAEYVRVLNHYQPMVMTGYAYPYFALAQMMKEQRLTLNYTPKALVLGAEKLSAEMKQVLQEAFHARAYEEYGSTENCVLATECEHGRLHTHPDFGILELLDAEGQPVPPGVDGRILGTTMLNYDQPLIRYELGDVGVWAGEKCPCGREHLPVLQEVVGRLDDTLSGPDGRQVARLSPIFKGLNVLECQIIQETLTHLVVNVVARPGFGPEDERLIRDRLVERLGEVAVTIQEVPEIPRTERGKFRAVVCQLPPGDRPRCAHAAGAALPAS